MNRRMYGVRKIATEISNAADSVIAAYKENRVFEEPDLTSRIIGAIEDRVNNWSNVESFNPKGINWKARSFRTSRGLAAEEKRYGADLMGILSIDLPNYQVKKGFLAQAKRIELGEKSSRGDWHRLCEQCEKMLDRTSESFVWVYSKSMGIRIFPAISVLATDSRNIYDLYSRGMTRFFEKHIECFIGDRRLHSTDIRTLETLKNCHVENVLELSANND